MFCIFISARSPLQPSTNLTLFPTQGGVKAVVYADSLQAFVMVFGVLAIVIQGCISQGGLDKVLDIAYHGDRMELFK